MVVGGGSRGGGGGGCHPPTHSSTHPHLPTVAILAQVAISARIPLSLAALCGQWKVCGKQQPARLQLLTQVRAMAERLACSKAGRTGFKVTTRACRTRCSLVSWVPSCRTMKYWANPDTDPDLQFMHHWDFLCLLHREHHRTGPRATGSSATGLHTENLKQHLLDLEVLGRGEEVLRRRRLQVPGRGEGREVQKSLGSQVLRALQCWRWAPRCCRGSLVPPERLTSPTGPWRLKGYWVERKDPGEALPQHRDPEAAQPP